MKLIFSFLVVFICVSCSKKNTKPIESTINEEVNEITFFKNDTLRQIIDRILIKNNEPKNINIELLDLEKNQFIKIEVNDSVNDCSNIKGFFTYKKSNLVLLDYSQNLDFSNVVDLSMSLSLNFCDELLRQEKGIVMDPKTYVYRINNNGKITYPNGDSLVFKNEKIKIEYWQVDEVEDELKVKDLGNVPNIAF